MRIVRSPSGPRESLRRLSRLRRGGAGALLLVGWSALVFAIGAATHATGFFGVVVRPVIEGGVRTPARWLRAQLSDPERIEVDLAFEDLQRLEFQRARAIEEKALFAGEEDEVPARIRADGRRVRAKLRLKGDSANHLIGEKWSFRVDVRGDGTLFGMKRFSLQHPRVRGYLSEWVYHRAMAREDVIALRYDFVHLTLNGKSLGIYALEEHFDKRLVEHNRRREGPILRFDEDLMWREAHHQTRPFQGSATSGYGDYEASAIDGFRTAQTLRDPVQRDSYVKAVQLLEAFRRGERGVGEVFDLERMATYFALVDLLGAEHGARWHNIRFYFNPVTSRLEPISFDGECTPTRNVGAAAPAFRQRDGRLRESERPFRSALFADPAFERRYLEELARVSEPSYLEALWAELRPDLERALRILHREFPQVEAPTALLERNRAYLRSMLEPIAAIRAAPLAVAEGRLRLAVANLQALPTELVGLEAGGAAGGVVALDPPRVLEGRGRGRPLAWHEVEVPLPGGVAWDEAAAREARALWRIVGTGVTRETALLPVAPEPPEAAALEDPTRLGDNSADFAFLRRDDEARALHVAKGSWRLDRDLRVGPGWELRAGPGTRIDLARGASVVTRSPVRWTGSEDAPVELVSSDGTGGGLLVLGAAAPSVLEHVRFRGLRAPEAGAWSLTGAVTFYESDVDAAHTTFSGNASEDALNVIRAHFRLDEVEFRDTSSDAFDADFCDGEITNSRFVALTNDAIDVSGSTVRVQDVVVEGAGDKGISVGEASDVEARGLRIRGAKVALASKDRSTLVAEDVVLQECRYALAAFQKKSEFGPGSLAVRGLRMEGMAARHLVERGSRVTVDGREIPASDDENIREILYGDSDRVAGRR